MRGPFLGASWEEGRAVGQADKHSLLILICLSVHPDLGSSCHSPVPCLVLLPLGAVRRLLEPCGNMGLGKASKVRCLLRNEIGNDATSADKWPVINL